jgi:replicative DNA helicase
MAKSSNNQKNNEIIGKIPPQNIEAEQSVLGSLLIDKDAIIKIADTISPEDFYRDDHAIIFNAILALFEKRSPIDLVTLTDYLEKSKKLKDVGGASYLATLVNFVPSAAHVKRYAEIVHTKATLRRLISAATNIIQFSYNETDEVDSVLDKAESELLSVSQKFSRQYFIPVKSVLTETFDRIDELSKHKGKVNGVSTGFKELDNLLAGLQPSDLIILAARPSMGKTSFALNVAQHVAVRGKIPVGVFSLEQSKEQIVDRIICGESNVDGWKLRTGNLTDEDFPKIGQAMAMLSEAPIFIDDSPMLNIMEIRTKARRLQSEHGLGLIIIDYLQLMQGRQSSRDINRVQEISEISRGLKAIARELNIPVVALSQLSRAVEHRPDKRPQLADLRESGSIEQDADVVMFIYRDDYYDPESEKKNIAEVLIKKHRNGPIGSVELYFIPNQTKFRSIETRRDG